MGRMLEIVTPLHKATKRDYLARMNDDKVHCMVKAKEYEFDYWDGDRRYGYGGYKFIDGRWKPVAQALIDIYGLKDGSSVLDVGCGKAFLLYEMKKILPGLKIAGFDISQHGLADARDEVKQHLFRYRAQDRYPYGDGAFDLAGVANADRVHLHPERLRRGLDGAELRDAGGIDGIAKHCRARHTWRDLLEKLQPFPAHTVFENHKTGDVAARPGQAIDDAGADRIGYAHKHDRQGAGDPLQSRHA